MFYNNKKCFNAISKVVSDKKKPTWPETKGLDWNEDMTARQFKGAAADLI